MLLVVSVETSDTNSDGIGMASSAGAAATSGAAPELRLAAGLPVQLCTGCTRAACVCSTACRRVSGAAQRAAREPYHKQTHATSQLHRARTVHVPLIAVVCVMGFWICMLVCGMSCHMPTSSGSVTVARREYKEGSKIAHNCPQLPKSAHNCHDLLENA